MHLILDPSERRYLHWPVIGTDAVPKIKVGAGDWTALELASGYTPNPVVAGATWYRALFAHPDATSNPTGTFVISVPTYVRVSIAVSPQQFVEDTGWVIPR